MINHPNNIFVTLSHLFYLFSFIIVKISSLFTIQTAEMFEFCFCDYNVYMFNQLLYIIALFSHDYILFILYIITESQAILINNSIS